MESTYQGDEVYKICCTGDAVVGDEVRFERALFGGTWWKPEFLEFELLTGKIIRDSYGRDKQQHTFTLLLDCGSEIRIKGRNLYAEGLWRKSWPDEESRVVAVEEKHRRGRCARAERWDRLYED